MKIEKAAVIDHSESSAGLGINRSRLLVETMFVVTACLSVWPNCGKLFIRQDFY
jgi:hypothetical protein